jgi:hypothetical protein
LTIDAGPVPYPDLVDLDYILDGLKRRRQILFPILSLNNCLKKCVTWVKNNFELCNERLHFREKHHVNTFSVPNLLNLLLHFLHLGPTVQFFF